MKPRYRIVIGYAYTYRVEIWRWYWPVWTIVGGWFRSVEQAEAYARQHAQHVVKYVSLDEREQGS